LLFGLAAGADISGEGSCFFFEGAETEIAGAAAIHQVFVHEWFETAAAFALSDMNKLMQEQFPILPAIGANNNAMTDRGRLRGIREDLSAAGGICQLFVFGHRHAIDYKDTDACRLLDPSALGIRNLIIGEWGTVFKDVGFLAFRPLVSK
jgi:hypothetical protein